MKINNYKYHAYANIQQINKLAISEKNLIIDKYSKNILSRSFVPISFFQMKIFFNDLICKNAKIFH